MSLLPTAAAAAAAAAAFGVIVLAAIAVVGPFTDVVAASAALGAIWGHRRMGTRVEKKKKERGCRLGHRRHQKI